MLTTHHEDPAVRPPLPPFAGLLVLFALLCAGCATPGGLLDRPRYNHEYELLPGHARTPETTRALLLPMNAASPSVGQLEVASDEIHELVERYLESQGMQVKRVSPAEFNAIVRQSARRIAHEKERRAERTGSTSAEIRFADLVPSLVREIDLDTDIVVAPNLVLRDAPYVGQSLVWDGVRRRERTDGLRIESGALQAASHFVLIYDRNGREIFRGYGGLDPIWEIDLAKRSYVLREDLLQNQKHLKQGVCISFHPYFGDDVDC